MFQKLEDFYTQELRIDLAPAALLAELSPQNEAYRAAAEREAFFVSVLQGDVQEGAYVLLKEQAFDHFSEARAFYKSLISENPNAAHLDFVAYPSGVSASLTEQEAQR